MIAFRMRTDAVVISNEFRDQVVEMTFAEDHELVQALPAYRADDSFASAVQSRRQLHLIATMRVELFG